MGKHGGYWYLRRFCEDREKEADGRVCKRFEDLVDLLLNFPETVHTKFGPVLDLGWTIAWASRHAEDPSYVGSDDDEDGSRSCMDERDPQLYDKEVAEYFQTHNCDRYVDFNGENMNLMDAMKLFYMSPFEPAKLENYIYK